ncbi:MAG: DUF2071 domain-containing protein [Gemmatimonadaceae bacterium]
MSTRNPQSTICDPAPPARAAFVTARWHHLAMLNYEVPPAILEPLVPRGTELDLFGGAAYASVVGFRFLGTRVLGVAVPMHRDFDEVNLRFYVRRRAEDGEWRRGVVFVRELVPRSAIALVARVLYNEPYLAVPMRHAISLPDERTPRGEVRYDWRHNGRWQHLALEMAGAPRLAGPASIEEFITEHYWGYTRRHDGGTSEYRVEHPRWNVWPATRAELDVDASPLYGAAFADLLQAPPSSALIADGSPITVYVGQRIT